MEVFDGGFVEGNVDVFDCEEEKGFNDGVVDYVKDFCVNVCLSVEGEGKGNYFYLIDWGVGYYFFDVFLF